VEQQFVLFFVGHVSAVSNFDITTIYIIFICYNILSCAVSRKEKSYIIRTPLFEEVIFCVMSLFPDLSETFNTFQHANAATHSQGDDSSNSIYQYIYLESLTHVKSCLASFLNQFSWVLKLVESICMMCKNW